MRFEQPTGLGGLPGQSVLWVGNVAGPFKKTATWQNTNVTVLRQEKYAT